MQYGDLRFGHGNDNGTKGKEGEFMTDNELLLAISNIMDKKIQPLQEDVKGVKDEVEGLKDEVEGLKDEVEGVKDEVEGLKDEVQGVEDEIVKMKHDIQEIKLDNRKIHLQLENNIVPHLNELSQCYTSTYRKYSEQLDNLEGYREDVVILKEVMLEHSKKLKQLS